MIFCQVCNHLPYQSFYGNLFPGWKVCQLRTECQETDKILRTKNEINVRTKIKIEIARDGPIPIFHDNVLY